MNCNEIQPMLAARECGDLDAASVAEIETHLRECAACRQEAQTLAETWRDLRAMPTLSAPRERLFAVRAKALEFVEKPARESAFSWQRIAIASAIGCVAMLAAAALFFPTVRDDAELLAKNDKPAAVADQFWTKAESLNAEIQQLQFAPQSDEFADVFSLTVQQLERDLERLQQSEF
jgi:anti-sigma factor RsiW